MNMLTQLFPAKCEAASALSLCFIHYRIRILLQYAAVIAIIRKYANADTGRHHDILTRHMERRS
jgi:hypothetical protein